MERLLVLTALAAVLLLGGAPPSRDPFALVTARSEPLHKEDLLGKVWVAYSFFASCKTSCPLTALQAGKLVKEFGDRPDFRVVGLTTDPERDTPERLATLSAELHADPERWLLVTGRPEPLKKLMETDFRIGFDPPSNGDHGGHAALFVLVGRDGKPRGYYRTGDRESFTKLRSDLTVLLSPEAKSSHDHQ